MSLPPGFTWITLDGSANEWPDTASAVEDSVDPGASFPLDLRTVRAFHDDVYSYIFIETWERIGENAHVTVTFSDGTCVTIANEIVTPPHSDNANGSSTGAASAARSGIEIRLPRRWTDSGVADVYLRGNSSNDLGITDCIAQPLANPEFNSRAPFDLNLANGLLVTVSNNGDINVRSGPSTATTAMTMVPNGTVFAAIGRNEDASWVQVRNAGLTGWVSAPLVVANGNLQSLPVAPSAP